jgi:hypothetical protein
MTVLLKVGTYVHMHFYERSTQLSTDLVSIASSQLTNMIKNKNATFFLLKVPKYALHTKLFDQLNYIQLIFFSIVSLYFIGLTHRV